MCATRSVGDWRDLVTGVRCKGLECGSQGVGFGVFFADRNHVCRGNGHL